MLLVINRRHRSTIISRTAKCPQYNLNPYDIDDKRFIEMGKKKDSLKSATPRQMWRDHLSTWNARRLEAAKLAKKIVDLRNETTYSTTEKVDTAIGSYMRPSNLFIDVSERLYSALSQLESKQER